MKHNSLLRRDIGDRKRVEIGDARRRAVATELAQRADALALEVVEPHSQTSPAAEPNSIDDRIVAALADAAQPQPFADLRAVCRVRTATLYERLAAMTTIGRIVESAEGYRLAG